jgi:hypothetical protein
MTFPTSDGCAFQILRSPDKDGNLDPQGYRTDLTLRNIRHGYYRLLKAFCKALQNIGKRQGLILISF